MKKLDVINTWAFHGIQYLFLADFIDKYYFATIRAFVLVQGLELILKAYILAKKENEYLSIESESEAKEKIDKIAKKYNHKFNKMIKDIGNNELEKVYKNHSINGIKTSTLLKRIIQESRYPVPERLSVFKEFPVNKSKELKSYFKNADDNSYVDIYF